MVNNTISISDASILKIARKLAIVQSKLNELDKLFRQSGGLGGEDLEDQEYAKTVKEDLLNQLAETVPNWKDLI